jgi:hypothetical protein
MEHSKRELSQGLCFVGDLRLQIPVRFCVFKVCICLYMCVCVCVFVKEKDVQG